MCVLPNPCLFESAQSVHFSLIPCPFESAQRQHPVGSSTPPNHQPLQRYAFCASDAIVVLGAVTICPGFQLLQQNLTVLTVLTVISGSLSTKQHRDIHRKQGVGEVGYVYSRNSLFIYILIYI